MRISILSLFFLAINAIYSIGQQNHYNQRPDYLNANSIWVFGNKAGLDFNNHSNGNPEAIQTRMIGNEGYASVSDPVTGKLLFYTNGQSCWNSKDQLMPNGENLLGNGQGLSTAQGVCIVPFTDSQGKYYLFSLNGLTNHSDYAQGSLFYSIVDMNLNSGLGDIDPGRKNIKLDSDTLSEGMIAIPGDNCDVWLMVHTYNKPIYKAYHITASGINTTPKTSTTEGLSRIATKTFATSYMAISPDRKKIAISSRAHDPNFANHNAVWIGDFDPVTGEVSKTIKIIDFAKWAVPLLIPRGVCFSPDNSKLYAIVGPTGSNLYQYDLSVFDSASIVSSATNIGLTGTGTAYSMRLYNDTIYMDISETINNISYVSRINRPNLSGAACNYQNAAIPLLPGTECKFGLGSEVVYVLRETVTQILLDTLICGAPETGITLTGEAGYASYEWNDGTSGRSREINSNGNYYLVAKDFCRLRVDTFIFRGMDFTGPTITINTLNKRQLGTVLSYDSYQWMLDGNIIPNATGSTYTASVNGDYSVIVENKDGCSGTSDIYKITNIEESNIHRLSTLTKQITVYPNPAFKTVKIQSPVAVDVALISIEGRILRYANRANAISLNDLAEGIFFLKIYDLDGNLIKIEKIVKASN